MVIFWHHFIFKLALTTAEWRRCGAVHEAHYHRDACWYIKRHKLGLYMSPATTPPSWAEPNLHAEKREVGWHRYTVNFRLVVHITQYWNMNWPITFEPTGQFGRMWLVDLKFTIAFSDNQPEIYGTRICTGSTICWNLFLDSGFWILESGFWNLESHLGNTTNNSILAWKLNRELL